MLCQHIHGKSIAFFLTRTYNTNLYVREYLTHPDSMLVARVAGHSPVSVVTSQHQLYLRGLPYLQRVVHPVTGKSDSRVYLKCSKGQSTK